MWHILLNHSKTMLFHSCEMTVIYCWIFTVKITVKVMQLVASNLLWIYGQIIYSVCAAESDCVRDDDLGFTSHSASICKHISVVLFYFEVIMMVQETCLKSTWTNCIHVNHSSEQTITHCDCSDYVAYSHHKDVKIWSMF